MIKFPVAFMVTLSALTPSSFAQTLLSGSHSIDGNLCIGPDCGTPEVLAFVNLKVKSKFGRVLFRDTSTNPAESDLDWSLNANGQNSEHFSIASGASFREVFRLQGGAPENALFVDDGGEVGFGTSLPQTNLHIVDSSNAEIRLEESDGSSYSWDIGASDSAFYVRDNEINQSPFIMLAGAPAASLFVSSNGNVGLGALPPLGRLHTKGEGVQLAYFESSDGGPVQVRFRTDSENRRFLAVNNANEVKSQIIFLDDRINFTGQTDSGANLWLSIGPDGITSQGPTCGSPCDLTFDPEYFTVPPIAERATYMWENMHLPAIGPTSADEPINLTEKTGGIIHELEVAHIYIEELHSRLEAQELMMAEQAELNAILLARLDALESD